MKRTLVITLSTALASAVVALPLAGLAQQAPAKKASPYKAPRNALGQPDIGGAWNNASLTPEQRPAQYGDRLILTPDEVRALEGETARINNLHKEPIDPNAPIPSVGGDVRRGEANFTVGGGNVGGYERLWLEAGEQVGYVAGQPRTSIITTPNGRAPPRKGAAAAAPGRGPGGGAGAAGGRGGGGGAAFAATGPSSGGFGNSADNPENLTLGDRCLISFGRNSGPPMFGNGYYNNNYQIVQSRDGVAINVEMVHDTRNVRLNSTHRTDGIRPWFGDSIGWYEGDTLVVSTVNIPQRQAYQGAWENLRVIERFTRVGPERLLYQFTVEDPTVWDTKWGGEYEFNAVKGQVYEYACHEGNYGLTNILAGARAEEKMASQAPPAPAASR